jgi:hypothetical protein
MVYIKIGNDFADNELINLCEFLELLDSKLDSIESDISEAQCPDSDGLFEKAEYFVGLGFTAIPSIHTQNNVPKPKSLDLGEKYSSGSTIVSIINATANYWKHQDEWGLANIVFKDTLKLKGMAKKTVMTIEEVTPWADYTCSNVIAGLTSIGNIKLSPLISVLTGWRSEIDRYV